MKFKENMIIERKIGNDEELVRIELTDKEMNESYNIQKYNSTLKDAIAYSEFEYEDYDKLTENEKLDLIKYIFESLEFYNETNSDNEYEYIKNSLDEYYEDRSSNKIEEAKPAFTKI